VQPIVRDAILLSFHIHLVRIAHWIYVHTVTSAIYNVHNIEFLIHNICLTLVTALKRIGGKWSRMVGWTPK
jgi:hypothetical protein